MKDKDNTYEELKAIQKRNSERITEMKALEAEIEKVKGKKEEAKMELYKIEEDYQVIKDSGAVRLGKKLIKLRRFARNLFLLLTGRKKWRQLFSKSWKKKRATQQIKRLKYNLYEQGFTDKALEEFEEIIEKTDNPFLRRLAIWELALWYANQYNTDSAKISISLLRQMPTKLDNESYRKKAIMEAECYEILAEIEKGKAVLLQAMQKIHHVDLYLAMANLESLVQEKVKWINKALDLFDLIPISLTEDKQSSAYDSITVQEKKDTLINEEDQPLVTIIIPVFNAGKVISTCLDSLLKQTWKSLELLIVDDCSTDNTISIVKKYCKKDSRIQLLKTIENGGAYIARNIALKRATGEFVTVNDADDWSHPEKIEKQVIHLINNPTIIANTSQQARSTEELKFYRRGKPGSYMFANMSSLMFRRKPVMEKLGYWDRVRFGADGEFKRRLKLVFGEDTVVDLHTGPCSFQRQSSHSLTGNQVFGYPGFFMGARKEYFESYNYYHRTSNDLYYHFNPEERLFAVPEPMWPKREEKKKDRRHFDVIIASEFRLLGGTNMSNIEEIKAHKKLGLRTGLIQMSRYDFHSEKAMNPRVRELIEGDKVQVIVYGEKVSCDVLILRHPPILQERQRYIPDVQAQNVRVIINQPPKRDYSENGTTLYDLVQCKNNLIEYFGKKGIWYPIGPLVRETLVEHHSKELKAIKLAPEDWVNIIDVDEWKRNSRPQKTSKIKIGRHSRSQYVKWPIDRQEMLMIYPDTSDYEICVLGGAEAPKKVLGELPDNWKVYEFGEVEPKEFPKDLDVFVYYTHPDWVEAFGRVIFEAMAVGVPVIIPPHYENLFGEAAIYANPSKVKEKIDMLMKNDDLYESQVKKAQEYVEKQFGYSKHASRLQDCMLDKTIMDEN